MKNITEAAERSASADDIYSQRDIADDMLAFWGGIENSTADITLKAFVFIGKYIERIDLYTRFHLDNSELDAPLAKLETYSRTLDGMPLPSCFVSGISWLLGQLPSRGYPELTSRLNEFLTDFTAGPSPATRRTRACSTR